MRIKIKHKPKGRKIETLKGSIIKEYGNFYLMQTPHYKTCVNKNSVKCGAVSMEVAE